MQIQQACVKSTALKDGFKSTEVDLYVFNKHSMPHLNNETKNWGLFAQVCVTQKRRALIIRLLKNDNFRQTQLILYSSKLEKLVITVVGWS